MNMKTPFEKVVEQHGPTVLRVCRAILGPHDAEDAWSETFCSAMRAYPDLPATANVEAWLVTIAHHTAIDAVRASNRRPVPTSDIRDATSQLGIPGQADEALWTEVAALPDKQRQVLAYRYLAGLAYADIADIVGGSPDAARRAAADGVKNLRKRYLALHAEGATK